MLQIRRARNGWGSHACLLCQRRSLESIVTETYLRPIDVWALTSLFSWKVTAICLLRIPSSIGCLSHTLQATALVLLLTTTLPLLLLLWLLIQEAILFHWSVYLLLAWWLWSSSLIVNRCLKVSIINDVVVVLRHIPFKVIVLCKKPE